MTCLGTNTNYSNNSHTAASSASTAAASSSSSSRPAIPFFHSHFDFEILNLINQPIWVFDVVRRSMFWANPAALELWNAPDLPSLLSRSFKDMSESTQMRLDAHMEKFLKNESVQEQWTFYHQGKEAVVVDCIFKGISVEEGRMVMLVQGTK